MGIFDFFRQLFNQNTQVPVSDIQTKTTNHSIQSENAGQLKTQSTSIYKDFEFTECAFQVVGLKYENDNGSDRQFILKYCKVGDEIKLKRTPSEKYPNAIQVHVKDGCIGYISEYDNKRLAKYLDNGGEIYDAQIQYMYTNSDGIISVCEIYLKRHKMNNHKKDTA